MRGDDAAELLERAGFEVDVVEQSEPATATARLWGGRVWRQTPVGGEITPGSRRLTIWVNP